MQPSVLLPALKDSTWLQLMSQMCQTRQNRWPNTTPTSQTFKWLKIQIMIWLKSGTRKEFNFRLPFMPIAKDWLICSSILMLRRPLSTANFLFNHHVTNDRGTFHSGDIQMILKRANKLLIRIKLLWNATFCIIEEESGIGEEKNQRSRKYVLNFIREISLKRVEIKICSICRPMC